MNCEICKEKYNQGSRIPKVLPCGHTYCINCISGLNSCNFTVCPHDKTEFPYYVENLPTNLILLDMISNIEEEKNSKSCVNGHRLDPISEGITVKCDVCLKRANKYMSCQTCAYFLCIKCLEWQEKSTIIDFPGLLCYSGHSLRLTSNAEDFYTAIRKKRPEKFHCDGCISKKKGSSGHCRACKFDYCEDCMNHYKKINSHIENIQCDKTLSKNDGIVFGLFSTKETCKGKIGWRYINIEYKCGSCRRFYNKSGSYICKNCKSCYCIPCTYNKINYYKM